ncbi:hypothetical protein VKT23_014237 [Stygiomarasmius scandens]|uniref:F-box domain-containing protein n=1 Tax=Marasmiellus scandens TaxID=2682957 RepID=A0ABR1J3B8_9AGAR
MDLPDELIKEILDNLIKPYFAEPDPEFLHSTPRYPSADVYLKVTLQTQKDDTGANSKNPLYHLSMVNHRLRRISCPMLFSRIHFELMHASWQPHLRKVSTIQYDDILERNANLAHLVKYIRLTQRDPLPDMGTRHQLIINILAKYPHLEELDISCSLYVVRQWSSEIPVFQAANRHPSPTLRVVYLGTSVYDSQTETFDPTLSLSRIVVHFWLDAPKHVPPGLRIWCIFQGRDDWHQRTYFGLRSIKHWSNHVSDEEFADFLTRHPELQSVGFGVSAERVFSSRLVALAAASPQECAISCFKIIRFDVGRNDWHPINISVTFKVITLPRMADIMLKLGRGLPHLRYLCLNFEDGVDSVANLVRIKITFEPSELG